VESAFINTDNRKASQSFQFSGSEHCEQLDKAEQLSVKRYSRAFHGEHRFVIDAIGFVTFSQIIVMF